MSECKPEFCELLRDCQGLLMDTDRLLAASNARADAAEAKKVALMGQLETYENTLRFYALPSHIEKPKGSVAREVLRVFELKEE